MDYSIIGTGNMATFLSLRLKEAGHNCIGIYGRNVKKTAALAKEVYANTYGSIMDVKDESDVCIMAVSDHAIEELSKPLIIKKGTLIHTAGSISIDVTSNAAVNRAVMWPIYSILKNDLPKTRNIPCAWEASSDKAQKDVLAIIAAFSDIPQEVKGDKRLWLHFTAVLGNNFINHLATICAQICEQQQLPFTLLEPILLQTIDRIAHYAPSDMQTGPAKRNDLVTINKHLGLLDNHPEWGNIYKAMTESIAIMYHSKEL